MAARPAQVRNVRLRTLGSGTRLTDEFRMPFTLYHGGRLAGWALRHWRRVLGGVLFIALWGRTGSLVWALLLEAVLLGGGLTAWLLWRTRGAEGASLSVGDALQERRHRATLLKQWGLACRTAGLVGPERRDPPALRNLRSNGPGSLTAVVRAGEIGVPVPEIQKHVVTLSEVVGCLEVVVQQTGPGVATLTFHWSDPIGRTLPLADLPVAPAGRLAYGVRQDGTPATVWAMQSLLIGGLTRHGKSNIVWALIADAIRQGIPLDLYVSDPKEGLELQEMEAAMKEALAGAEPGMVRVRRYAASAAETAKMVEAAEKAANARKYTLRQDGVRKLEAPTPENPLVVTILDEVLALSDMIKKGEQTPLGRLLYMGATAGYVVWMNTQAAQLEVMGNMRRFVPQRICVATDAPGNTDSILGAYAESKGARCSEIRVPGVGYSNAEGESRPLKFRAAYVSDAETKAIARGRLPKAVADKARELYDQRAELEEGGAAGRGRRTALYRWYHADAPEGSRPGYIGISYDVLQREAQHSAAVREFMNGDVRRTVEWFPSRREALRAEEAAIKAERPLYNVIHNGRNPWRLRDRGGRKGGDREPADV